MVMVGATGSGKTNLMIRLWAGWFTATLEAARAGRGPRPLLIVLDCKRGRDARTKAERTRRLIYACRQQPQGRHLARRRPAVPVGPARPGPGRAVVPDGRHRDRRRGLLRRHLAGRGGPGRPGPVRAAGEHRRPGLDRGEVVAARLGRRPPPGGAGPPGPRAGTCPTFSSGTPPCLAYSVPRWTVPVPWPRRTSVLHPGRAPVNLSVAGVPAMALTELAAWRRHRPGCRAAGDAAGRGRLPAVARRVPISNLYERGRVAGHRGPGLAQSLAGPGPR